VTDKLISPPLAIFTKATGTSSLPPRANNSQRFNNVIIQFDDMPPPVAVRIHVSSENNGSNILRGEVGARRAKSRAVQKIAVAAKSVQTKVQQAPALQAAVCHLELQSIATSASFAATATSSPA
jgi:hypothetical protein